jgi:hypothetical protein
MTSAFSNPVPNLTTYEALRYQVPRPHLKTYDHITSPNTLLYMSFEITRRLEGVLAGRHIVVPDATIWSVMDTMYQNYQDDSYVIIMSTIAYIVEYVKNDFQQQQQNNALDIWVQSRPANWGMQRYDQIKLRERRPTPMIFTNNY